jgi:hypothetical protein
MKHARKRTSTSAKKNLKGNCEPCHSRREEPSPKSTPVKFPAVGSFLLLSREQALQLQRELASSLEPGNNLVAILALQGISAHASGMGSTKSND